VGGDAHFFSWGTLKVIGSLIALLLLFGTLFWLVEKRANPEHFGGSILKGISSGVYWVGSTLASGVCFGVYIRSAPGRIIGLLWMFVCAVVLGAFVASLTSSLTLNRLTARAVDFREIAHLKLGTVSGGYTESLLKSRAERYTLFQEEEDVLRAIANKEIEGFCTTRSPYAITGKRIQEQDLHLSHPRAAAPVCVRKCRREAPFGRRSTPPS